MPFRAISLPRDGVRPVVINKNRQIAGNRLLLKSLAPGESAGKTIFASEFYGEIGQRGRADNSIQILPTINSLFHEAITCSILLYSLIDHWRRHRKDPPITNPGTHNYFTNGIGSIGGVSGVLNLHTLPQPHDPPAILPKRKEARQN